MKIHYVILTVLFVGMVVLGSVEWMNSLSEGYGETVDLSSINSTNQRLEDQRQDVQNLSSRINNIELNSPTDFFAIPYELIQVGWSMVKVVFGSWSVVGAMITDIGTGLSDAGIGLPDWLIPTIIAIVAISLVIILIYALFKWRFES